MHRFAVSLLFVGACAGGAASPGSQTGSATTLYVEILDAGPLGCGECAQISYRVKTLRPAPGYAAGKELWVHFEECPIGSAAHDSSSLKIGKQYQLEVQRGGSPNFDDHPLIVRSTLVP